ncbi:biopolymer transporter ExbD [Helicobacter valdiviensis]|uniref:Biopolymer transporter ExbD n=1 Tax=Helicobacter valdiviensis TaxID=1458358 RepID=A0A2W6MT21_9HELI|nr:biopolymer transporter ExbD [Helicobacter valdiviensis]PZT47695.1 biopolymer transporter ExbD [Helicobacter valdiviensis]
MSYIKWDENPELNITPLVDIMLVLLAILMVTAPVIVYQEEITLPQGSKTSKITQDSKIEIRIDAKRKIYLKEDSYDFRNFADAFMNFSNGFDKNTQVYIRADKNLKYDDVIYILKVAKEAGFLRVSLVTDA